MDRRDRINFLVGAVVVVLALFVLCLSVGLVWGATGGEGTAVRVIAAACAGIASLHVYGVGLRIVGRMLAGDT